MYCSKRTCCLPVLSLIAVASSFAFSAEPSAEPRVFPFWDGVETIADYAKRVNLPATKTLDLGGGVKMELVLIPAGKFVMGTPEPTPPDKGEFKRSIVRGQTVLAMSVGTLFVMLSVVCVRAIRQRKRPKVSLARLLAMTFVAGVGVMGGMHWRQSALNLERSAASYLSAINRLESSYPNEQPAYTTAIMVPFYMSKCVVTQEQWLHVMGHNPSKFSGKHNPVEFISWYDANLFCKFLSDKLKEQITLPSEAEWEFACRAGTTTAYYSGDSEADLSRVAWYDANSKYLPHPVAKKEPNLFGLYDMHGNVWQWCRGWYEADFRPETQQVHRLDSTANFHRVLRGGSAESAARGCRSANRRRADSESVADTIGLRVVVTVP